MRALFWLRAGLRLGTGLLLAACGEKVEEEIPSYYVGFARPFPSRAADKAAFPARHQGVYTAADSTTSLCIGATAVWQQKLHKEVYSLHQPNTPPRQLTADTTYQDIEGQLHYVHLLSRDSVRDSWLQCDTIFQLAGTNAGRLRKFQGRYYLSTPVEDSEYWQVQRLEIAGRHLVWQNLGQDTLRLRVLDTASVRVQRKPGFSLFRLRPAPGQQMRRTGDYAGLWETAGEFERRH